MTGAAYRFAAAALFCAVAAVGCGFGAGEASEGEANLRVTREFGAVPMVDATVSDPTESDTVVRVLDENADVDTSYGDNFVDSIDGYAGSTAGGGQEDWFFFVNGYYSDIGAGETKMEPGDRVWWDYRYWAEAYRVPAVVGSWPEPFLHGESGDPPATVIQCFTVRDACDAVAAALSGEGADAPVETPAKPQESPDELRILVGPWDALRSDPAARQIEAGPGTSGVYAQFVRCGDGPRLTIDDSHGRAAEQLDGGGLIAAVRDGEDQPTWVVTGTDADATAAAALSFGADALRDRYAVAVDGADTQAVPAPDGTGAGAEEGCR